MRWRMIGRLRCWRQVPRWSVPLRAVDVFLELVRLNAVVELRGRLVLGFGRCVLNARGVQRAEAGTDSFDHFVAAFDPCESHVTRAGRVNVILHEQQSQNSQTHNSHSTIARCTMCSEFIEFVGRWGCTRTGCLRTWRNKVSEYEYSEWVRRSAVHGSAHIQQTPLKLHAETWEGLLRNRARRFSGRWKSYRGVLFP